MDEHVKYEVTELTDEEVHPSSNLGELNNLREVFLGDFLDSLLANKAARGGHKFRLEWKGTTRVPRTEVGGHQIDWTQHGIVYENGKMVGTYERIKDLDGPNRDENEMLIVFNE